MEHPNMQRASYPARQSISISGRGRKYGEEIVASDSGIETAEAVMMMMTLSVCIYTNGFLTTPLAWQLRERALSLASYISIMHAKGLSLPLSGKE